MDTAHVEGAMPRTPIPRPPACRCQPMLEQDLWPVLSRVSNERSARIGSDQERSGFLLANHQQGVNARRSAEWRSTIGGQQRVEKKSCQRSSDSLLEARSLRHPLRSRGDRIRLVFFSPGFDVAQFQRVWPADSAGPFCFLPQSSSTRCLGCRLPHVGNICR